MSVSVYIARNHLGQFSRGFQWVDDFKDGRFYTKRGPVANWVTREMQDEPDNPVPEILVWDISPETARIFGSVVETKKRVQKVAQRKAKREQESRASLLEHRKQEAQRLQAEIARLEAKP